MSCEVLLSCAGSVMVMIIKHPWGLLPTDEQIESHPSPVVAQILQKQKNLSPLL
jgi:hypothetical protein